MSGDLEKIIEEGVADAGGDLCKLLKIAAASSSDELMDDEHLAQNVLVLCERAAIALESLQKRSLLLMREREEARADLAAERERKAGFVLVPLKPTKEMLEAGAYALKKHFCDGANRDDWRAVNGWSGSWIEKATVKQRIRWDAMIQSASAAADAVLPKKEAGDE